MARGPSTKQEKWMGMIVYEVGAVVYILLATATVLKYVKPVFQMTNESHCRQVDINPTQNQVEKCKVLVLLSCSLRRLCFIN